jgi:hypothetical protein
LSTKIHVLVDARGNPLRILLTQGQIHDLVGADALLPQMASNFLIADKSLPSRRRGLTTPMRGSVSRWPTPENPL